VAASWPGAAPNSRRRVRMHGREGGRFAAGMPRMVWSFRTNTVWAGRGRKNPRSIKYWVGSVPADFYGSCRMQNFFTRVVFRGRQALRLSVGPVRGEAEGVLAVVGLILVVGLAIVL